jgi:hypothetical protein
MSPQLALNNFVNGASVEAKGFCQFDNTCAHRSACPNIYNVMLGEFRIAMILAVRCSALLLPVSRVIARRAEKQVSRVDTRRVITAVQNVQFWPLSIRN